MSGFWLVSYVILWLLLIGAVLVILAMAREVEALHSRLDRLQKYLGSSYHGVNGREGDPTEAMAEESART